MRYDRRWFCSSSVTCCATCKEEPGVAGSTFDGGLGTRWWQDVDGVAENEGWAVGVVEDRKVGVYGDVTVDRSGSGMLDGGWNFIWDDCGVPVEEDAEVGEVMSLIGLADGIWSEVVLSDEEKSWWKGGDAVNVCDFGGAVGELSKSFWRFELKGVAVAVFELKGLTWVRKMEVVIWSMMIVTSTVMMMMMMIVVIVVIARPAMFQSLILRIWYSHFQ